jgi:flagellar biosynthesis/type III secretory pathway M-ring protein FliF/YscJ
MVPHVADPKIVYYVSAVVLGLVVLWALWVQVKFPTRVAMGKAPHAAPKPKEREEAKSAANERETHDGAARKKEDANEQENQAPGDEVDDREKGEQDEDGEGSKNAG